MSLPFFLSVCEKINRTSVKPDTNTFTHSPLRPIADRTHCSLFRAKHTFGFEVWKLLTGSTVRRHGNCSWTVVDDVWSVSWWAVQLFSCSLSQILDFKSVTCFAAMTSNKITERCLSCFIYKDNSEIYIFLKTPKIQIKIRWIQPQFVNIILTLN